MPMYNYHCTECKHQFEKLMKIADMNVPTDAPCPECWNHTVVKSVDAPAYHGEKAKLPTDFKELMKEMKKNVYKNNLPDYM